MRMLSLLRNKIRYILEKETGRSVCESDWDYEAIERFRDSLQDDVSRLQYEHEIAFAVAKETLTKYKPQLATCLSQTVRHVDDTGVDS